MTMFLNRTKVKALLLRGLSAFIRNRSLFVRRDAFKHKHFLNIGCGKNIKPGFICLDFTWRPGIDLCWDITNRLPFRDEEISGIFSEHCLEHVEYAECFSALKEFFRVIKPGGVTRIVVPDGGLYLDLYAKAKRGESVDFPYRGNGGRRDFAEDSSVKFTPMIAVNRVFRGYGHLFAYDFETLASMLECAGFINVVKLTFNQGHCSELLIDSAYRAPQSLYIEAIKPA